MNTFLKVPHSFIYKTIFFLIYIFIDSHIFSRETCLRDERIEMNFSNNVVNECGTMGTVQIERIMFVFLLFDQITLHTLHIERTMLPFANCNHKKNAFVRTHNLLCATRDHNIVEHTNTKYSIFYLPWTTLYEYSVPNTYNIPIKILISFSVFLVHSHLKISF